MPVWKKRLLHSLVDAENHIDLLKYRLRERLGGRRPLMIQAYHGCGTADRLYLKGRVLEDKGVQAAREGDDLLDNLLNTYRRAASAEIPFARVCASFQGIEQEVVADEEGFFDIWINLPAPLEDGSPWQEVALELLEPRRQGEEPARAVGKVFVPPSSARFGVISDIDDTVVQTGSDHLLRIAGNTLLGNARTRLPFNGASAFYRALYRGVLTAGGEGNPLFFVSGSPWNLYDLFLDFFNLHEIPGGPLIFLRDWGLAENDFFPSHTRQYKLGWCRLIMDLYRDLPFILVGDSGQMDPEIYQELVDLYPGRIRAIYIRSVSRRRGRVAAIQMLAEKTARDGSQLVLAENTQSLVAHARSQGWIE